MAFNSNVPNATDRINATQATIKSNFGQLETTIEVDHVALNAGADTGKHKQTTFPELAAGATTLANEGALYTKESSTSGAPRTELFFRRESNGDEIEVTGALAATSGYSWLPSGILMQWGSHNTATAVTFPIAFPNNFFSMTATAQTAGLPSGTDQILSIVNPTTTQADVSSQGPAQNYRYIVIGN